MNPATLTTIANIAAIQLAEIKPIGLCLVFGLNNTGKLQLTLGSINDDAVDINIDEDTDHMTADIIAEDMVRIMHSYCPPLNTAQARHAAETQLAS